MSTISTIKVHTAAIIMHLSKALDLPEDHEYRRKHLELAEGLGYSLMQAIERFSRDFGYDELVKLFGAADSWEFRTFRFGDYRGATYAALAGQRSVLEVLNELENLQDILDQYWPEEDIEDAE